MNDLRNILDSLQYVQAEADKVPDLAKRIAELEAALASKTEALSKSEADLIDEMVKTDQLTANVKALEVARDNAGFRADDAEDKLKKIQSVVGVQAPTVEPVIVPLAPAASQEPSTTSTPVSGLDVAQPVTASSVEPTTPVVIQGYTPAQDAYKPNVETSAGNEVARPLDASSTSTASSETAQTPSVGGQANVPTSTSSPTDYSPGDSVLADPYTKDGRQSSYIDDQGNRRRWNYTLSRWDTEAKEASLGSASHYSPDSLR